MQNRDEVVEALDDAEGDEICEMAPKSWKEDIFAAIDLEILLQVATIFSSCNLDNMRDWLLDASLAYV